MPMFEDNLDLARQGERPQKDASPPRQLPSTDQAITKSPSKPISIPPPRASSPYLSRKMSEESIRTDLCEGPVLDSPRSPPPSMTSHPFLSAEEQHALPDPPTPRTPPSRDSSGPVTDRAELIERLKRGESPTWVPNRHLESLFHMRKSQSPTQSPRPPSAGTPTNAALLPAADITPERIPLEAHDHDAEAAERLEDGLNIERPRSALHSGDFTEINSSRNRGRSSADTQAPDTRAIRRPGPQRDSADRLSHTRNSDSWLATSPPRHYTPFSFEHRATPVSSLAELGVFRSGVSSPSSSLSSSFVYKPPTSPLVQSQSNYDDDAADITFPMNNVDIALGSSPTNSGNMRTSARRHTLHFASHSHTPSSQSSPYPVPFPLSRQTPGGGRRESPFPYQAHQPRRSLSSTPNQHNHPSSPFQVPSSPQASAFSRSRRPSFASDTSPLQHASMVGSYEESILRGRMSTTPSKPLDFLAQIGVLGLGAKCKPSLRCPAHVTLPFSAVFYSYATTSYGRSKAEEGPSPYVGMVDLENGLPNSEAEQRSRRKAMMPSRRTASRARLVEDAEKALSASPDDSRRTDADADAPHTADTVMEDVHVERIDLSDSDARRTAAATARSHRRRQNGPKAPPGGSYRIPQQGQLQIIIKNQNKTAVKLFLIPYDLTGMEPGTKTFIRQRSYSAGPIIDNMPSLGELASSERPILRYLIHLHICCPSRGRYYLYKSIRVVFANRVPDGKEKLRNELTFPEPRYSPYKPIRVMHPPMGGMGGTGTSNNFGGGGLGAALAAEKAYRRRSSGFTFSTQSVSHAFEAFGIQPSSPPPVPALSTTSSVPWPSSHRPADSSFSFADSSIPVEPMPRRSEQSPLSSSASQLPSHASSSYVGAVRAKMDEQQEPDLENGERKTNADGPAQGIMIPAPIPPLYKKLSKGDVGYGGNAFVPMVNGSPAAAEGLLSQRLRSLEVQKNLPSEESKESRGDD